MAAVVLPPACGKSGGPQSPGGKGPCTTERERSGEAGVEPDARGSPVPDVVLGTWDFGGLSVCGDVTCVVSVGEPLNRLILSINLEK